MAIRRARAPSMGWEWLQGAALVGVAFPVLTAMFTFFLGGMAAVVGHTEVDFWSVAGLWALATTVLVLASWGVLWARLSDMREHLHPRETRDLALFRVATGANVDHLVRQRVDDLEVVHFDLRYVLARSFGPVVLDPQDFTGFRHPVLFCILPSPVPAFRAWPREHVWKSRHAKKVLKGRDLSLHPELDAAFAIHARDAIPLAATFDDDVIAWFLAHPTWSVEVTGDRLLAFPIGAPRDVGVGGAEVTAEMVEDVVALVRALTA